MEEQLTIRFKIWRQESADGEGGYQTYTLSDVSAQLSFIEALRLLNEQCSLEGAEPVAFQEGCGRGECGACAAVVNGRPHGPVKGQTLCQLRMGEFKDNALIVVEPLRAKAFPMIKDLLVDRSSLERLSREAVAFKADNPKDDKQRDLSATAADCIRCGACVAVCPQTSAALFMGAVISEQGVNGQQPQQTQRLVERMEAELFGPCYDRMSCVDICPKGIPVEVIGKMKKNYARAVFLSGKPGPGHN